MTEQREATQKIWIRDTQILSMTGAALQRGDILIEEDKLAAIGAVDAQAAEGAQIIDGRDTLAMPGLVNTHTHAAMTLLRSYADDMELMPWLNDKIWPAEAKFVNESIYWGSSLAVLEMLQSGTTTFADMYDSMHEVARVVEESGVRANLSRGLIVFSDTEGKNIQKNVRLYELGNVYLPKQLPLTELPEERMQFTLGMYGEGDFFVMKGVVEEFFGKAGLHKTASYDPQAGKPFLHPGRQANIIYDGEVMGYLGEIHPAVADKYGIGEKAYVAVLDIPRVVEYASFDRKFEGIAKFPAVTRDISMMVSKDILAGQIEAMILQRGGKHLESLNLFDIYEGEQVKKGYKSMAYSLVFRAKDKTMTEDEITSAMKKVYNGLESMGIELRQ